EAAAHDLRAWQDERVLAREAEAAYWWLAQDYVGPDGVARTREGIVAALRLEPYDARVILPHERTHAGPKEGRLRLLRATRTQLEPLFFLWEGTIELDGLGEPDLAVEEGGVAARLWRLDPEFGEAPGDEPREAQLLLAGGGLDPEVVEGLGPQGVSYTPSAREAVAAVDRGEAEAAFLLRPTRIEDVWAVAGRGEVMPQKSTFFYPKLTSGLLMLPLD